MSLLDFSQMADPCATIVEAERDDLLFHLRLVHSGFGHVQVTLLGEGHSTIAAVSSRTGFVP